MAADSQHFIQKYDVKKKHSNHNQHNVRTKYEHTQTHTQTTTYHMQIYSYFNQTHESICQHMPQLISIGFTSEANAYLSHSVERKHICNGYFSSNLSIG